MTLGKAQTYRTPWQVDNGLRGNQRKPYQSKEPTLVVLDFNRLQANQRGLFLERTNHCKFGHYSQNRWVCRMDSDPRKNILEQDTPRFQSSPRLFPVCQFGHWSFVGLSSGWMFMVVSRTKNMNAYPQGHEDTIYLSSWFLLHLQRLTSNALPSTTTATDRNLSSMVTSQRCLLFVSGRVMNCQRSNW